MKGVEFAANTIRVTRIDESGELGEAIVVRGGPIEIAPNIKTGGSWGSDYMSVKNPDTFNYWEFDLTADYDTELFMLGSGDVAFEMWTEHLEPAKGVRRLWRWLRRRLGKRVWIHWVFPRTRWSWASPGHIAGVSATDSSGRTFGTPDGASIAEGGYWKTNEGPPR